MELQEPDADHSASDGDDEDTPPKIEKTSHLVDKASEK